MLHRNLYFTTLKDDIVDYAAPYLIIDLVHLYLDNSQYTPLSFQGVTRSTSNNKKFVKNVPRHIRIQIVPTIDRNMRHLPTATLIKDNATSNHNPCLVTKTQITERTSKIVQRLYKT